MCGHDLAHDFDVLAGALSTRWSSERTAAEILVEAKLSAKSGPEVTPGRRSSSKSREGNQLGRV
jgi:hypothetical protein